VQAVRVDVAEALGVPVARVVLGRPVSAVSNIIERERERVGTRAGAHVADRRAHLLTDAQRELAVVLALWRLTWVASEPIGHLTLRYPSRSAPNLPRPATSAPFAAHAAGEQGRGRREDGDDGERGPHERVGCR
jgi:hypothetical protein